VALEPVLELVDACAVVPSLCCGEVIEAVAFDAGDGAFQRAVGFVVLEEEDCGTQRDRIVIADGGSLPRRGDGLVIALVEPDNATRIRIEGKIGVWQKLVNGAQLRSVVGRYSDEDVGMEIDNLKAAVAQVIGLNRSRVERMRPIIQAASCGVLDVLVRTSCTGSRRPRRGRSRRRLGTAQPDSTVAPPGWPLAPGRLARKAKSGAAETWGSHGTAADLTREPSRRPSSGLYGRPGRPPDRRQAYGPPPLSNPPLRSRDADVPPLLLFDT
jgi:hypothetical protein